MITVAYYPSPIERLQALRDILSSLQEYKGAYDDAEWLDIVNRLTLRISDLEREAGEVSST